MQMFTNLPRDVVTNGWHFVTDDVNDPATDAAAAVTRLVNFYGDGLLNMVANYISGNTMRFKAYDLSDPEPRAPVLDTTETISWGTKSASYAPTECAAVLSFHASPTSGVPAGRLRNRVYLGGLDESAFALSTTGAFPMLSGLLISQVSGAASALLADNTTGLAWVGVSRASGLAVTFPIAGGWVDNSPDTQRRRGINATVRTTWT